MTESGSSRRKVISWVAVAVIGLASVLAIVLFLVVPRSDDPASPGWGGPTTPPGSATELAPLPKTPQNSAGDLADVVEDVELLPGQVLYLAWQRDNGAELEELWVPYDRGAEWLFRSTVDNQEQRAAHAAGRSDDWTSAR